jgi:hypothetical protein
MDIVRKYPGAKWDYEDIVWKSDFIQWSDVYRNPKFANYLHVAKARLPVTPEIIGQCPDVKWLPDVMQNRHLPMEYIRAHMADDNVGLVSRNPHITPEFVSRHPEVRWIYNELAKNKNFTFNIINSSAKLSGLDAKYLNPNLTWEIAAMAISALPSHVIEYISGNEFQRA